MKKFNTFTLAVILGSLAFSSQAIAKPATKYKLDQCYAEQGEYLEEITKKINAYNFCSKQAFAMYDRILAKTKPNFNKEFVLIKVPLEYRDYDTLKKTGGVANQYIAINPKTKQGFVFPYNVQWDGNHPKKPKNPPDVSFSLNSNKLCSKAEYTQFVNGGFRYSHIHYKDEKPLCFSLHKNGNGWDMWP